MRETIDVEVHSAPKYGVFIGAGAILGIVAALIVVSIPPRQDAFTPEYSLTTVFGFFAAFFAIAGALLGASLAVILDRVSRRKSRRYQVEGYFEAQRRPDAPDDDEAPDEGQAPGATPDVKG